MPSQSTLKPYTHLGNEPVDFVAWRQIVLPTMNVHLLALDKRNEDDQFVNSSYAMHYCNICIPFSPGLFDGVWDPNALIARLVECVMGKYSESPR